MNNNRKNAEKDGEDLSIGKFLYGGTGVGNKDDTLALLYAVFMEQFASDGGKIIDGDLSTSTIKFFSEATIHFFSEGATPRCNLWAIRPVAGLENGRVYSGEPGNSTRQNASFYERIPDLKSGNSAVLKGYGSPVAVKGATHEMLYKLEKPEAGKQWLNITAPNDGNERTLYYAVLANDDAGVKRCNVYGDDVAFSSGANGADVYPLTKGVQSSIDTQGRDAYLFVSTLYQNVDSSITYTWSNVAAPTPSPGTPSPSPSPDTTTPSPTPFPGTSTPSPTPSPATTDDCCIDYSNPSTDIIVNSSGTPKINLSTEILDLGGFVPAEFDIGNGKGYKAVKADTFGDKKFPKLLNKGLTLKLKNAAGTEVTFPAINPRPKPKFSVNYELVASGGDFGQWVLTEKNSSTAVKTNIQIGIAGLNDKGKPGKTVDTNGWGKFYTDGGICVKPIGEKNGKPAVVKTTYFFRQE
ncbi:MAG: hypothetical protein FWH04_09050, partial [Oscillospiraceae bacterium]|nr:hypothetical protein [Oscillospiraceae bacterium]